MEMRIRITELKSKTTGEEVPKEEPTEEEKKEAEEEKKKTALYEVEMNEFLMKATTFSLKKQRLEYLINLCDR
jgi:hypothetical protein